MQRRTAIFVSILLLCLGTYRASAIIDVALQIQLGNPSGATADTNNHDHYLLQRTVEAIDYSKKFENFEAAVALKFAYYNFIKTHGALRMTPAQAAGVEKSAWTVAELVEPYGE